MHINNGFGWTFNTQAAMYDKMRPGYVQELYDDIFRLCPVNSESNVVEIGIGSGQATRPFLETGCSLTAIECGDRLAELSRQKFCSYPRFSVITSKFEDCPREKDTCDLIFSATAFHWIPEDTGYPKVFEMLKSGGVFARFANHPYKDKQQEALHRDIQQIYSVYMPGSKSSNEFSEDDAKAIANIASRYGFINTSWKLYHRIRTFSASEYIQLLGTYSTHLAIEENTRKKFFSEIESAINSHSGEIRICDTIDLELAQKP